MMSARAPLPRAASDLYGSRVRDLEPRLVAVAPCPVCTHRTARLRYAAEGVDCVVVVCEVCGLGSLHPMPDRAEVAAFYPDSYYGEPGIKFHPLVEHIVRWVGARHVRFLSLGLPPGARVLDVGCGRGVVLGALADRGFAVHGTEVSAAATRGADPRAEIRIAERLADARYPRWHFDQVLVWHVLEHLVDPRETLEEVHRILRPGGRLIVAVPNFASWQAEWSGAAWFHLDLPRHLYHFPLDALRRLLDDTGFEPVSDHHFSLRQNPFGWIQSALNRCSALPRNGLYTLLLGRGRAHSGLATRAALLAAFALLAPFAIGMSIVETAFGRGATVHVVALRRP